MGDQCLGLGRRGQGDQGSILTFPAEIFEVRCTLALPAVVCPMSANRGQALRMWRSRWQGQPVAGQSRSTRRVPTSRLWKKGASHSKGCAGEVLRRPVWQPRSLQSALSSRSAAYPGLGLQWFLMRYMARTIPRTCCGLCAISVNPSSAARGIIPRGWDAPGRR